MKVCLIEAPLYKHAIFDPIHKAQSLGLGYLGSFLKEKGIEVSLIEPTVEGYDQRQLIGWSNKNFEELRQEFCNDLGVITDDKMIDKYRLLETQNNVRVGISDDEIASRIRETDPDVIGIGVLATVLHPTYISLVKTIKKSFPDKLVIAGGDHPTNLPRECLETGADFIVIGEGEDIFYKIIQNYNQPQKIKMLSGVAWLENGKLKVNNRPSNAVTPKDLLTKNQLPILNPTLFTANYPKEPTHAAVCDGKKYIDIMFSRGCHGRCSFCNSWRMFGQLREYHLNQVKKQLNLLKAAGYQELIIQDDNFTLGKHHREIIDLINDYGFSWQNNGGLELEILKAEDIDYAAKRGCHALFIPINIGRVFGKPDLTKKLQNQAEIIFKQARKNNLYIFSGGINGIPPLPDFEKMEESMESFIKFAVKLVRGGLVDYWVNYILDALPNCEWYNNIVNGKLKNVYIYGGKDYWSGYSHHTPQIYTKFLSYRKLCEIYLRSHREINGLEKSKKWFASGAWVN